MLEWLPQLVQDYGLIGLMFSSLIGSTVFLPFTVELTFPLLIRAGISKVAIIWFAAIGALTGTYVNYILGYMGVKFIYNHTNKEERGRARRFMDRYGWAGVFMALAIPIPLPVDFLTILPGAAKMNPFEFTAVVFTAKIIKYALILGVISIIL